MKELRTLFLILGIFLICYFFPLSILPFKGPLFEAFALLRWYAREHVILCLVPAFFIAGAITVFLKQESVMKYFGPDANKFLAYSVASVSGTILAVCSCTVLPIFSGIYKRGAGLGPASTFLYSGPAINVLAIILSARILGIDIGIARALGAIILSIIIGLLMHFFFLSEEKKRKPEGGFLISDLQEDRPLWKTSVYFASMVGILVFANWGRPQAGDHGVWTLIFNSKWIITAAFLLLLGYIIFKWFQKEELTDWTISTWGFSKQILPLLLMGVLVSGLLLGRPGFEGLIPSRIVTQLVGGNSILANLFASIFGAFMYFATLTEVPILQGLIGSGMGKGPALALLLSGPAVSLPSMLVINSVLGLKKTAVFVLLVIVFSTLCGFAFGALFV